MFCKGCPCGNPLNWAATRAAPTMRKDKTVTVN
jgi:hypothetical protein